jgi:hypothetical protein
LVTESSISGMTYAENVLTISSDAIDAALDVVDVRDDLYSSLTHVLTLVNNSVVIPVCALENNVNQLLASSPAIIRGYLSSFESTLYQTVGINGNNGPLQQKLNSIVNSIHTLVDTTVDGFVIDVYSYANKLNITALLSRVDAFAVGKVRQLATIAQSALSGLNHTMNSVIGRAREIRRWIDSASQLIAGVPFIENIIGGIRVPFQAFVDSLGDKLDDVLEYWNFIYSLEYLDDLSFVDRNLVSSLSNIIDTAFTNAVASFKSTILQWRNKAIALTDTMLSSLRSNIETTLDGLPAGLSSLKLHSDLACASVQQLLISGSRSIELVHRVDAFHDSFDTIRQQASMIRRSRTTLVSLKSGMNQWPTKVGSSISTSYQQLMTHMTQFESKLDYLLLQWDQQTCTPETECAREVLIKDINSLTSRMTNMVSSMSQLSAMAQEIENHLIGIHGIAYIRDELVTFIDSIQYLLPSLQPTSGASTLDRLYIGPICTLQSSGSMCAANTTHVAALGAWCAITRGTYTDAFNHLQTLIDEYAVATLTTKVKEQWDLLSSQMSDLVQVHTNIMTMTLPLPIYTSSLSNLCGTNATMNSTVIGDSPIEVCHRPANSTIQLQLIRSVASLTSFNVSVTSYNNTNTTSFLVPTIPSRLLNVTNVVLNATSRSFVIYLRSMSELCNQMNDASNMAWFTSLTNTSQGYNLTTTPSNSLVVIAIDTYITSWSHVFKVCSNTSMALIHEAYTTIQQQLQQAKGRVNKAIADVAALQASSSPSLTLVSCSSVGCIFDSFARVCQLSSNDMNWLSQVTSIACGITHGVDTMTSLLTKASASIPQLVNITSNIDEYVASTSLAETVDYVTGFTGVQSNVLSTISIMKQSLIPVNSVLISTRTQYIAPMQANVKGAREFINTVVAEASQMSSFITSSSGVTALVNNMKLVSTASQPLLALLKELTSSAFFITIRDSVDSVSDHLDRINNIVGLIQPLLNDFGTWINGYQFITGGDVPTPELTSSSLLSYCGTGVNEHICLHNENRSPLLYKYVLFPSKYVRFWDLSTPPLLLTNSEPFWMSVPGLWDKYSATASTFLTLVLNGMQTSHTEYLVALRADGPYLLRRASLFAIVNQDSSIKKIFELRDETGGEWHGSVDGIAIAQQTIWTIDDAVVGNWLVGFSLASLVSGRSTSGPTTLQVTQRQSIAVKPSSLFYMSASSLLWVGEYADPKRGGQALAAAYSVGTEGTLVDSKPRHILRYGNYVRGLSFFTQIGVDYAVISVCAYTASYRCRIEFHRLPRKSTVTFDGSSVSQMVLGSSSSSTLQLSIPTPMGLAGLAFDQQYYFLVMYTGMTLTNFDNCTRASRDREDRFFLMRPPILRSQKPTISKNSVHIRVAQQNILSSCLISLSNGQCEYGEKLPGLPTTGTGSKPSSLPTTTSSSSLGSTDAFSSSFWTPTTDANVATTGDNNGCLSASFPAYQPAPATFFSVSIPIPVVITTVWIKIEVTGAWGIAVQGTVCLADKSATVAVVPWAGLTVNVYGYVEFFIIRAGLKVTAEILNTRLVPSLTISVNPLVRADLVIRLEMIPLAIQMDAFVQFFFCWGWLKISLGWISFSIPWPQWCPEFLFRIFRWESPRIVATLFSLTIGGQDWTAPSIGKANIKQIDGSTIGIDWNDIVDTESGVSGYEVALGGSSGAANYYGWTYVSNAQSTTLSSIILPAMTLVYANVRASNAGGLQSVTVSDPLYWDITPSIVSDLGILRTDLNDGSYGSFFTTTTPTAINARFKVSETGPHSTISNVWWGIGTIPDLDDILSFEPIGYRDALASKSSDYYYISSQVVDISSTGLYWLNVKTINNVGLIGTSSKPFSAVVGDVTSSSISDVSYINSNWIAPSSWLSWDTRDPYLTYEWNVVDISGISLSNGAISGGITRSYFPTLINGNIYYVIGVGDSLGRTIVKKSAPLMYDSIPPLCSYVRALDPLGKLSGTTPVQWLGTNEYTKVPAIWSCNDTLSGIMQYSMGMAESAGSDSGIRYVSMGTATSGSLSLQTTLSRQFQQYYVAIRACDRANNCRTASSQQVIIDLTGPKCIASTITMGPDWWRHQSYTNSTKVATVWFKPGFIDDRSPIIGANITLINFITGRALSYRIAALPSSNTATFYLSSQQEFAHNTRYVASFLVTNGAGVASYCNSSLVVVDLTPPLIEYIHWGSQLMPGWHGNASISMTWQRFPTSLYPRWFATDNESPVSSFDISISRSDTGEVVHPRITLGKLYEIALLVPLVPTMPYRAQLWSTNEAGVTNTSISPIIRYDATMPAIDALYVDKTGLGSYNETIHVTWIAYDAESGISSILIGLGTGYGVDDGVSFRSIDANAASYDFHVIGLPERFFYFVTLRIVNGAQTTAVAYSRGMLVDRTPPSAGIVRDGSTTTDIQYTPSADIISASWAYFFDYATPSLQYDVSVGTSATATDVVSWTDVGTVTFIRFYDLPLVHGQRYYVNVRANDVAGLTAMASSNGVISVQYPPSGGSFWAGSKCSFPSTNDGNQYQFMQAYSDTMSACWNGFTSIATPIRYMIGIGSESLSDDVESFTLVSGFNTNGNVIGTLTGLELDHAATYYMTIRATNAAGLLTTLSSQPFIVDLTPPVCLYAYDGNTLGLDIDLQSKHYLSINWNCIDHESPLSIIITAGRSRGSTSITSSYIAAMSTNGTGNCTLPIYVADDAYWISVTAINHAGLRTTVWSDGVMVDGTPPFIVGSLLVGLSTDLTTQYSWNDINSISGQWLFRDIGTGMSTVEFGVSSSNQLNEPDLITYQTFDGASTYATLLLNSGTTLEWQHAYYLMARATDNIGNTMTVFSNRFVLDDTPPSCDGISVPLFWSRSTSLSATWNCSDSLGIRYFEWSIDSDSLLGTGDMDWSHVNGLQSSATANLVLSHGTSLIASVRAVNWANMMSNTVSTQRILVDLTAPVSSILYNTNYNITLPYQLDNTTLAATWTPFVDIESQICDVVAYAGTSPGLMDTVSLVHLLPTSGSLVFDHLVLITGRRYYITVIGTNCAGIPTRLITSPILIDARPPSTGSMITLQMKLPLGYDNQSNWVDGVVSSASIVVTLSPYLYTAVSGVTSLRVALVNDTNDNNYWTPWLYVNARDTRLTFTDLTLTNDTYLHAVVHVVSGVGLQASQLSSQYHIQLGSVHPGLVYDGVMASSSIGYDDIEFQYDSSQLWFHFTEFSDPMTTSSLLMYSAWAGTTPGSDNIASSRPLLFHDRRDNEYSIDGVTLVPGPTYYVTVRATGQFSEYGDASSNGVRVVQLPPIIDLQLFETSTSSSWVTSTPSMTISWQCNDPHSRVSRVTLSVGTYPWSDDMISSRTVTTSVHLGASVNGTTTFTNDDFIEQWQHGIPLYVSMRCGNVAGYQSQTVTSKPLILDASLPVAGTIVVTNDNTTNAKVMTVLPQLPSIMYVRMKNFADLESDIAYYIINIGTMVDGHDLVESLQSSDIIAATPTTLFNLSSLASQNSSAYTLYLQSCAFNWLNGTACSTSSIIIDTTAPIAGDLHVSCLNQSSCWYSQYASLAISWNGWISSSSGPTVITLNMGRTAGAFDLWSRVISSSSGIVHVRASDLLPQVIDVSQVYITMVITSASGLSSNISVAATMDVELPSLDVVIESVVEVTALGYWAQSNDSVITATWSTLTTPVPIGRASLSWFICENGEDVTDECILSITSLNVTTISSSAYLSFQSGRSYVVGVVQRTSCGRSLVSTSRPVMMDITPPRFGSLSTPAYVSVNSNVTVSFMDLSDGETGVASINYYVDTSAGDRIVSGSVDAYSRIIVINSQLMSTVVSGDDIYITVVANNGVGLASSITSLPLLVDHDIPMIGQIVVANSVRDGASFIPKAGDYITIEWSDWYDTTSGILHYDYSTVSSSASCEDIIEWNATISSVNKHRYSIQVNTLMDGQWYIACLKAVDRVGHSALAASFPFIVDRTPPVMSQVVHAYSGSGTTMVNGIGYQSSSESIILASTSSLVHDSASGVVSVTWRLVRYMDLVPLTPFYLLSSNGLMGNTTLYHSLDHGTRYCVDLRATDASGWHSFHRSNGFIVDITPPIHGTVNVATYGRVNGYQSIWSLLNASWSGFSDHESNLASYDVCVTSSNAAYYGQTCDVLSWRNNGLSTSIVLTNLVPPTLLYPQMEGLLSLVVLVRATNRAGLTSIGASSSITFDTIAPVDGTIILTEASMLPSIRAVSVEDIIAIDNPYHVCARAYGWTDNDVVHSYSWSLSIFNNASSTIPIRSVSPMIGSTSDSVCWNLNIDATLQDGNMVTAVASIYDRAGGSAIGQSANVVVDTSPPLNCQVKVLNLATPGFTFDSNTLAVSISDCYEPHSSLLRYELLVCSSLTWLSCSNANDAAWLDIGLLHEMETQSFILDPLTHLVVVLRAWNTAGKSARFISTPFLVDSSPPPSVTIIAPNSDQLVTEDLSLVNVSWSVTLDTQSGSLRRWLSVGTSPDGTDILPIVDCSYVTIARLRNSTTLSGTSSIMDGILTVDAMLPSFNMSALEPLYFTLINENGAGLTTATSVRVLVDASPPLMGTLTWGTSDQLLPLVAQSTLSSVSIYWTSALDSQSSLASYSIELCDNDLTAIISRVEDISKEDTAVTFTNLQLSNGYYWARLYARNGAGGESSLTSSTPLLIDTVAPTVISVYEVVCNSNNGSMGDTDIDWYNVRYLCLRWAINQPTSGVINIEWAIASVSISNCTGTATSLTFVTDYNSAGTANNVSAAVSTLEERVRYIAILRVTSGASVVGYGISDGFTIDVNPPSLSNVTMVDGLSSNEVLIFPDASAVDATFITPVDPMVSGGWMTIATIGNITNISVKESPLVELALRYASTAIGNISINGTSDVIDGGEESIYEPLRIIGSNTPCCQSSRFDNTTIVMTSTFTPFKATTTPITMTRYGYDSALLVTDNTIMMFNPTDISLSSLSIGSTCTSATALTSTNNSTSIIMDCNTIWSLQSPSKIPLPIWSVPNGYTYNKIAISGSGATVGIIGTDDTSMPMVWLFNNDFSSSMALSMMLAPTHIVLTDNVLIVAMMASIDVYSFSMASSSFAGPTSSTILNVHQLVLLGDILTIANNGGVDWFTVQSSNLISIGRMEIESSSSLPSITISVRASTPPLFAISSSSPLNGSAPIVLISVDTSTSLVTQVASIALPQDYDTESITSVTLGEHQLIASGSLGNLFTLPYCPPHYYYNPFSSQIGITTAICVECPLYHASYGGMSHECVSCDDRQCTDASQTQWKLHPTEIIDMEPGIYQIQVQAIADNGAFSLASSADALYDPTPPLPV